METILSGTIFGICAVIMFVIGIVQLKSKEPVGFYSGETPPAKDSLTDVEVWNKKHGKMWILYGCCIVISWIGGLFCRDSILILIPYLVGLLLPLPFMILYHHKLIKKYVVNGGVNGDGSR